MNFTDEERKIIDILLKESDEEQRKNGNKLYSHEEVLNYFKSKFENDMKKIRKNKSYCIKKVLVQKGEKRYKNIPNRIYN